MQHFSRRFRICHREPLGTSFCRAFCRPFCRAFCVFFQKSFVTSFLSSFSCRTRPPDVLFAELSPGPRPRGRAFCRALSPGRNLRRFFWASFLPRFSRSGPEAARDISKVSHNPEPPTNKESNLRLSAQMPRFLLRPNCSPSPADALLSVLWCDSFDSSFCYVASLS